jgi:hypothetical protein
LRVDRKVLGFVPGQRYGTDALHRFCIDDEYSSSVVLIRVDVAVARIVGDCVDTPRHACRPHDRLGRGIDLGNRIRFTVTRKDVTRSRIDRDTVQRTNPYLAFDLTAIRVDDEQRSTSRVRCIHATAFAIDRDVVESTDDRNGLRRERRYKRHRSALYVSDATLLRPKESAERSSPSHLFMHNACDERFLKPR